MAVLTKNTDMALSDFDRVREVYTLPMEPTKRAFERINKAKLNPIYIGQNDTIN